MWTLQWATHRGLDGSLLCFRAGGREGPAISVSESPAGALLVGRERELAELLDALDQAATGRGRLMLIGGEPGIGKSRLADELASRARQGGFQVLWGRAWEDAGAPPYWPWIQALRVYLRSTPIDDVRRDLGSGAVDMAHILPELRDVFPDLPPPPDAASESARFQLFDSTATLLRNVAFGRPMLVVLDDLQAADTASILFLRFLASQLGDMPMMVVGTYRDVELTPEHPLTTAIAELAREPVARVLELGGLPADAVGEYLRSTTSLSPRDTVVAAVWRATNGNPLFVGEAVRLLTAEGRLTDEADLTALHVAVPQGVRAVIARRIGHLGDETARALGLGAALGPEFSVDVLLRIGDFESERLLDLIDDAVGSGLLVPVAGVRGRYRFSHDLVRETLYDELSPGRRSRLHGRIATVIEELYAASIDAHGAELAFHFVQAALLRGVVRNDEVDEGFGPKAVAYARQAGDDATLSLAYEEAARLYRMALAVLDLDERPDDETRVEVMLVLGDDLSRAGDLDAARAAFLDAAAIARRTGNGARLARAALGFGGRHRWARAGRDTRLIPLLQDALVMLGGGDDRLRVQLLTRLACAWRSSPERRDDSSGLSRQAVEIARRLHDPATVSDALIGRFWATWWPDNPDERDAIAVEVRSIADALEDGERKAGSHLLTFLTRMERGLLAEAREEMAALTRAIEDLRQPAHLWLDWTNRALLALVIGDLADAEEYIVRELKTEYQVTFIRDEICVREDPSVSAPSRTGSVGRGGIHGPRLSRRLSVVSVSPRRPCVPSPRPRTGCRGSILLDELAKDDFAALYQDNEWLLGMGLASEACALLGDASAAATLYEQLRPYAGRHAIGFSDGSIGAVDRYLGLLAATLGQLDDAIGHLAAAIEVNESMGARPFAAHCRHDLAGVLRQRDAAGDRGRADQLDAAARTAAAQLGMALASRIGAAEPAAAAVPSTMPLGVASFRREGEYWSIEFGSEAFRLRDAKGMRHVARLLGAPGREVHALQLAQLEPSPTAFAPARGELPFDGFGDAGPVLDEASKAAYRDRLEDLRTELS